jgi:hypothetical protein
MLIMQVSPMSMDKSASVAAATTSRPTSAAASDDGKHRHKYTFFQDMPLDLRRPIKARGALFVFMLLSHLCAVAIIPFALPGKPVQDRDAEDGFKLPGIGLALGFGLGFFWLLFITFVHSRVLLQIELAITLFTALCLEYMFFAGFFGLQYGAIGLVFLLIFILRIFHHVASRKSSRVAFAMLDFGRRSVLPLTAMIFLMIFIDAGIMVGFVAIYVMWTETVIVFVTGVMVLQVFRFVIVSVTSSYCYLWYVTRDHLPKTFKPQMELFRRAVGPALGTMVVASAVMDLASVTKYILRLLGFVFHRCRRWSLQLDRYTNRAGLALVLLKGKPLVQCCMAAHDVLSKAGTLDFTVDVIIYRSVFILSVLVATLALFVADVHFVAFLLAFSMIFTMLSVFDAVGCAMWLGYSQDANFALETGGSVFVAVVEQYLEESRSSRIKSRVRRTRKRVVQVQADNHGDHSSMAGDAALPDSHSDNDFDTVGERRQRDVPLDYRLDAESDSELKKRL